MVRNNVEEIQEYNREKSDGKLRYHYARPMNKADETTFDSAVDIIIPYHGQYDRVTNLIESIFKFTKSNYYKLSVVDDASPNEDFIDRMAKNAQKANTEREIFKAYRCKEQKGFVGAIKSVFEKTDNPYVCFVNSDCLVEDINWLRTMGECLLARKHEGVRMVCPRTNNPVNGDPAQKSESYFGVNTEDVVLKPGSYLSLYCFMCHRDLFSRCGGFLKEYPFGYYEDEEFAYRMNKYNFKQAICGKSWIRHEGEATVKYLWRKDPKIKVVMREENRQRCLEDMQFLNSSKK